MRVFIGVALSVVISRSFGVDVLGRFVLMEKIVATLIVASSVYTLPLIVSLVKEKAIEYIHFIRVNLLCYSILVGVFVTFYTIYYGLDDIDVLLYLLAGILETIAVTTSFYLIAQGKVASAGLVDGTLKLGFLILVISTLLLAGITSACLLPVTYLLANIMAIFAIFLVIKKKVVFASRTKLFNHEIKIKFYISRLINFLMRNSNILLASFLLNSLEVGYYSVAIKLSFSFAILYQITTNWQLPSIKRSLMNNESLEYVRRVSRITLFISTIGTIILYLFMDRIVVLWGIEKNNVELILVLLLIAQLINVSVGPVEQVLLLSKQEDWNTKLNLVSLLLQVALMLLLGSLFGLYGVVIGEITVFMIGNILRYIRIRKTLNIKVGII